MGNHPQSQRFSPGSAVAKKTKALHSDGHSQSTTAIQFQKDLLKHQQLEAEYEYLSKLTTFDEHTLRLLHHRFNSIDQTIEEDGQISIKEFAYILNMDRNCILLQRLFKFMDKSNMGSLNFRNFATALSHLSLNAPDEDKMKLSFFLYDINDDQKIDRDECRKMVMLALEEINMRLTKKQIDVIVNNTFEQADMNKDGVIDFQEYKAFCRKNPRVLQPFRIDVARLVQYEQENRRGHRYSEQTTQQKKLHHGPTHEKLKKGKIKKLKKKLPKIHKKLQSDKIERVRSIHNAQQILAVENDQFWAKDKKKSKNKNKKRKKNNNNKSMSEQKSVSADGGDSSQSQSDDDEYHSDSGEESQTMSNSGVSFRKKLALSADNVDRKKKKEAKYRKSKASKNKKNKKYKQKTHHSADDNDEKDHISVDIKGIPDADVIGLNTSQPRTPSAEKEKVNTITQDDIDDIQRILQ